jgi:Ca-activated chloride channel family protein
MRKMLKMLLKRKTVPAAAALAGLLAISCSSGGAYSPSARRASMESRAYDATEPLESDESGGTERIERNEFDHIVDNPFLRVRDNPLSTFSIDVDSAGYALARSFITNGMMPPRAGVRIEELVNYFDYEYAPPLDGSPFAVHPEVGRCPWNPSRLLARIGIKGREFPAKERPKVNLVFLLDVSGSMNEENKLPLLKEALRGLVERLGGSDRVAVCVYAGAAGVVLPPTPCDDKSRILKSLDKLAAGGSTAGGAGIELAYALAAKHFDPAAVNRVILCTDGDFNVGPASRADLVDLITEKSRTGVYLTVLGFGMGNYRDGTLKQLASKGNGNYGYIDTIEEANKLLGEELDGALITIARDVKIQVEFNPKTVGAYRLIGYENRILRQEDFADDAVDAGDIGAGHRVTAFYEIVLPTDPDMADIPSVDDLRYAPAPRPDGGGTEYADELCVVKIRYKPPAGGESRLVYIPVQNPAPARARTSDFTFGAAVAAFGMLLRDSPYRGSADFDLVLNLARAAAAPDPHGYRRGFIRLAETAKALSKD